MMASLWQRTRKHLKNVLILYNTLFSLRKGIGPHGHFGTNQEDHSFE
jgi:hypothetical protein